MKFKISKNRQTLTLIADRADRAELQKLESIQTDRALHDWLEPLLANSELVWVDPAETGDLTDAPLLGILGNEMTVLKCNQTVARHYGWVVTGRCRGKKLIQPILERWGFMDYQLRSPLEDLRDRSEADFIKG